MHTQHVQTGFNAVQGSLIPVHQDHIVLLGTKSGGEPAPGTSRSKDENSHKIVGEYVRGRAELIANVLL